jgi:phosphoglycolate phosphatase-like HAD superfamily hydrolase
LKNILKEVLGTETPGNKKEKIQKIIEVTKGPLVFVTDTKGDLLEAEELDITRVAVTWGYHSYEKLLAGNPTVIMKSPKELLAFLINIR